MFAYVCFVFGESKQLRWGPRSLRRVAIASPSPKKIRRFGWGMSNQIEPSKCLGNRSEAPAAKPSCFNKIAASLVGICWNNWLIRLTTKQADILLTCSPSAALLLMEQVHCGDTLTMRQTAISTGQYIALTKQLFLDSKGWPTELIWEGKRTC